MTAVEQNPHYMLKVVLATTMVTLFLGLPLPPTTTVVCFRWVWSVIVLYLTWYSTISIVLVTAAVVVTIFWINPLLQLLKPCFTVYLVLIRISVGGVLYISCIPLPLAWWHQHDITSIAKWRGQASYWLLAIWLLLSLNHRLWSSEQILLNTRWQSDNLMLLNSRWQFGDILLLLSFSSIFANLLLTSFFAPFLAARESDFSSCFYTFRTLNTMSYMRPHIYSTHYAFSWSNTLVGTWYQN